MSTYLQQKITVEERLKQSEIAIQDLIKKLKETDSERASYKIKYENLKKQFEQVATASATSATTITASSILLSSATDNVSKRLELRCFQELETILTDFNKKLTPTSFLTENVFESLLIRLFDLLAQNASKIRQPNIEDLKKKLFDKFQLINENFNRCRQYETKNVEYEHKIEQLSLELDSLKQAVNCKKLLASGELSAICNEFMKWKNEMKQLNGKVIEQNQLIHLLVRKYENLRSDTSSGTSTATTRSVESNSQPIIIDNQHNTDESSITSSSLAYETLDSQHNITDNNNNNIDPTIILENRSTTDVELQVYHCPHCNITTSNDVDFDIFTNHVRNCKNDKLVCMICLKFFEMADQQNFIRHVQSHDFD